MTNLGKQADMPDRTCSVASCELTTRGGPYCLSHYAYWRRTGKVPTHKIRDRQPAVCTVDGCDLPSRRNGMCGAHNTRMRKFGDVQADNPIQVKHRQPAMCIEPGCPDAAKTHSRCMSHFSRWWRYEAPRETRQFDPQNFWDKVDSSDPDGCWEWIGARHRNGYGQVPGFVTPKMSHRVSWGLTNGPIPDGMFVCHRCDNPPCCQPLHLFLGTHQENMDDMKSKGRSQTGPRPPRALAGRKLNWNKVDEIRELLAADVSYEYVAKQFDVTAPLVSRIDRGLAWNPARRRAHE